jgi:hypothetical protein
MEPYGAKFRGEVLAACDTNEERRVIALRFGVSESWLRHIQQQRHETGQVAAKKAAPRQPKWHTWADWLVANIAARPASGQPFADKTVVLDAAGFRAVGTQIVVLAGDRDDRLTGGPMLAILGRRDSSSSWHNVRPP